MAHVQVATVVNVARAIEELKTLSVWTVGLEAGSDASYHQVDLTLPTALVLGAEGTGLPAIGARALRPARLDPDVRRVDSLNVSVAAGVALFEAVRQRQEASRLQAGAGPIRLSCPRDEAEQVGDVS